MSAPTGFRLDREQRDRVRDCLAKSRAQLVEPFEKFIARIECSIDHFCGIKPEGSFREAHDALRQIWLRQGSVIELRYDASDWLRAHRKRPVSPD